MEYELALGHSAIVLWPGETRFARSYRISGFCSSYEGMPWTTRLRIVARRSVSADSIVDGTRNILGKVKNLNIGSREFFKAEIIVLSWVLGLLGSVGSPGSPKPRSGTAA